MCQLIGPFLFKDSSPSMNTHAHQSNDHAQGIKKGPRADRVHHSLHLAELGPAKIHFDALLCVGHALHMEKNKEGNFGSL